MKGLLDQFKSISRLQSEELLSADPRPEGEVGRGNAVEGVQFPGVLRSEMSGRTPHGEEALSSPPLHGDG